MNIQIFTTREISTFIWLIVISIFMVYNKNIRQCLIGIIKAFGNRFIVVGVIYLITYTLLNIDLLVRVSYWEISMLKDTLFWFLFSGLIIFFSLYKAREVLYFSNLLKNNIKAVIIFEFIANLYTFNLFVELLIFPIIAFASIIEGYARKEPNLEKISLSLGKILTLIGFSMILFTVYKTVSDYNNFFSILNLKTFLLPIILTVLSLPYFYGLTLYMRYENFITVVKHTHRNENPTIINNLIKATFKYANLNINTLGRIWKYQINFNPLKDNPYNFIKTVSKKPKHHIANTAKLKMFNNIQSVIKTLSKNGIGKLDEWHKSYSGDEYYISMTNYYQFGSEDITQIPNSLAYYLTGEELYIKELELVLDIGYQQDKSKALEKFINVIELTFNCLLIPTPIDLTESIILNKKFERECNTNKIKVSYEKFVRIEQYKLNIITK